MEGRKILCYPDRLSPHGRDDMWDMALGVWPCSAVLGKRLSEPSPCQLLPRGLSHCQTSVSDHGVLWELPMHCPITDWDNGRTGVKHHNTGGSTSTAKQEKKGPGCSSSSESSPVLPGKGMEMARTIPKPQLPQGKTLEAQGCHK